MAKKIILVVVIVVLLAGGFFIYSSFRSTQQAQAAKGSIETRPLQAGSLAATISATGKVRSGQTAMLAWQTSGVVDAVNAQVGSPVKAGDKLATLKQTSLPQNVIMAQADLVNARQALDNLSTQADQARVKAIQDIATYEAAVKDAQYQLDNFTIPTNQAGLDTTEALTQMKAKLDAARLAFEPYKYTASTNPTREDRKTALDNAQADYNAAIKRLQYEYQLEVAQSNLKNAWDNYDKYKDGPTPDEVTAAQAKIAAAEATLAQSWVEAPFSGTVTTANAQLGDKVGSGTSAFRVDDLSNMFIDLAVSEVDIRQIQVGQPVTVTLDALRKQAYQGEVTEVAMISSQGSNAVNFNVTVKLTNPDANVSPGMTAEVQVVVGQKDNALLIPNQAIQTVNGKQVVYVMKGQDMVPVPVTVGITSDMYSELASGELKAGELIVLNPNNSASQAAQTTMRMPFGAAGRPPQGTSNQTAPAGDRVEGQP